MIVAPGKSEAERTYQMVARVLEDEILTGRVSQGDFLPSEEKLALQLGVNRSTIREAFRLLEQNGLVRREAGRKKMIVSIPRANEIAKPLSVAMILHRVTFEELHEAMQALEPAAASAAAKMATPEIVARLEANLEASRQALDDSSSLAALDIEFHNLIAEASQNRAIQLARIPLGELFYPAFYSVMSRLNAGARLLAAHQHIVAAIRGRAVDDATSWMDRHIQDFRRGFELANLDIGRPITKGAVGPDEPATSSDETREKCSQDQEMPRKRRRARQGRHR